MPYEQIHYAAQLPEKKKMVGVKYVFRGNHPNLLEASKFSLITYCIEFTQKSVIL